MRHHNNVRKFGRKSNQRKALMRSLCEALLINGKIETTLPKAKELRPMIEKLITKGKEGTLAARRLAISRLGTEERAGQLMDVVAPKYKDRLGGYTRIVKLPARVTDASPMAIIELV